MLKLVRGLPSIPEKFPEKGYYMLTYWLTMSDWQNIGLIDAISDAISEHIKLKIFLGEHISPDPPRYRCFYEAPSIYRSRFPLLDMSHFALPWKISKWNPDYCVYYWVELLQPVHCMYPGLICMFVVDHAWYMAKEWGLWKYREWVFKETSQVFWDIGFTIVLLIQRCWSPIHAIKLTYRDEVGYYMGYCDCDYIYQT